MRNRLLAFVVLVFLVGSADEAQAQEHATAEQDLDAMVTSHAEDLDTTTADVKAKDAGIGVLRRAEAKAFVQSAENMKLLAVRPYRLDDALAGSDDTVTIKTTTIIIGLAVLVVLLAI